MKTRLGCQKRIQGDHYKRHDLKMLQLFHFLLDFNQTFLRCSSIYAKICVEGFSTIFWKIVHSLNGQTHVQNVRHHAAGRLECVAESYPQLVCTPLSGLFWFSLGFLIQNCSWGPKLQNPSINVFVVRKLTSFELLFKQPLRQHKRSQS